LSVGARRLEALARRRDVTEIEASQLLLQKILKKKERDSSLRFGMTAS